MDPLAYYPTFIFTVAFICLAVSAVRIYAGHELRIPSDASIPGTQQFAEYSDVILPFLICLVYSLFIGGRPLDGVFGDSISYARIYDNFNYPDVVPDWRTEWIWQYLMLTCKQLGLSSSGFFTVVSIGYFFTAYVAICILTPKDVMLTLLFVLSSLMFYSFGINGMRNGLACHIVLMGIALMLRGRVMLALFMYACAFGIHRSSVLPIASSMLSAIGPRSPMPVVVLWLACIPVSIVTGDFFSVLFGDMGFDYRMAAYASNQDMSLFSHVGFRWDFLLYSTVPVAMVLWVTKIRHITDRWYTVLASTYILCNAFWILVIRSAYSNRFAYLSWCIYPIVVAYPLVNLPVWRGHHTVKTAIVLIAYVAFTIILGKMWGML